jgi:hypothetical protein
MVVSVMGILNKKDGHNGRVIPSSKVASVAVFGRVMNMNTKNKDIDKTASITAVKKRRASESSRSVIDWLYTKAREDGANSKTQETLETLENMQACSNLVAREYRYQVIIAVLAVASIVLAVTEGELLWWNENQPSAFCHILKALVSGLTGAMMVLIAMVWSVRLRAQIATGHLPASSTIASSGFLRVMVKDIILVAIHCPFGFHMEYHSLQARGIYAYYTGDALASCFMFVRLKFLMPVLHHSLGLKDYHSRLLSKITGIQFNLAFTMKATFRKFPGWSLFIITTTLSGIFTYWLRVFERPLCAFWETQYLHEQVEELCGAKSFSSHTNIGNSLWNVLVTMSTLGYGDMYPTTLGGRLTAMSAVVSGVVLIALLVNVVTLQLNLSEVEHNTWNSIIHTQHEKQLKKKAAVLLEAAWLHRRASGNAYFLKMLSQWRAVKQYGIRNRAQLNGHTAAEIIREGIQRDLSVLTIKLDRIERELRSSRAERLVSSNRRPSSNPSSPCTQPDNS